MLTSGFMQLEMIQFIWIVTLAVVVLIALVQYSKRRNLEDELVLAVEENNYLCQRIKGYDKELKDLEEAMRDRDTRLITLKEQVVELDARIKELINAKNTNGQA